jgi:Ca-activated chloride channel family protein
VAVRLGNLDSGAPASVVIDLMVPARAAGSFRIAQAELHYTPLGGTEQVVKQDVLLEFTSDPNAATYDPRVMNLVEKVTAFKLQTRALSEADLPRAARPGYVPPQPACSPGSQTGAEGAGAG